MRSVDSPRQVYGIDFSSKERRERLGSRVALLTAMLCGSKTVIGQKRCRAWGEAVTGAWQRFFYT
jgi:hypothetical protein